jgi:hypothetical protein
MLPKQKIIDSAETVVVTEEERDLLKAMRVVLSFAC